MVGAAVLGIAILTILTWRPPKGSTSLDAAQIIGSYLEGDPALQQAGLYRQLALNLSENSHTNREELGATQFLLRLGLGMMPLEPELSLVSDSEDGVSASMKGGGSITPRTRRCPGASVAAERRFNEGGVQ